MADNSQNTNSQSTQQSNANQSGAQNNSSSNAAANAGWVTVNTSDSFEAQRMNIMKGNTNDLFTKKER